MAVWETKIDRSYPDSQFLIPGYYLHRNDRKKGGGGVLLVVSSKVLSKRVTFDRCYKTFEPLALEIGFKLRIASWARGMDFEVLPSPVLVDSVGVSFCWGKAKIDDSSMSRSLASSFASLVVDFGTGGGRGGGDWDFRTAFLSRQRCAKDKEKLAITLAIMGLIACMETNSSVMSALTVWPVKPLVSHHVCISSSMILKNQKLDRAGVEHKANRDWLTRRAAG